MMIVQVTKKEGNRIIWLVETGFSNTHELWDALCAICADAHRSLDGDEVWAEEGDLILAEAWAYEQALP